MSKINPVITVNGWNVYSEPHGFYCANNGKTIWFTAEYRKGTYFNVKSYSDGKRCYTAERYFYKLIPLVREMAFELLKAGKRWDYKNNRPALESYKKDIAPYYNKCKENGLSFYGDAEFLEILFN